MWFLIDCSSDNSVIWTVIDYCSDITIVAINLLQSSVWSHYAHIVNAATEFTSLDCSACIFDYLVYVVITSSLLPQRPYTCTRRRIEHTKVYTYENYHYILFFYTRCICHMIIRFCHHLNIKSSELRYSLCLNFIFSNLYFILKSFVNWGFTQVVINFFFF